MTPLPVSGTMQSTTRTPPQDIEHVAVFNDPRAWSKLRKVGPRHLRVLAAAYLDSHTDIHSPHYLQCIYDCRTELEPL